MIYHEFQKIALFWAIFVTYFDHIINPNVMLSIPLVLPCTIITTAGSEVSIPEGGSNPLENRLSILKIYTRTCLSVYSRCSLCHLC